MGRPRTINRDELLDAAGRLAARGGASSLSFGSVATAASLSKATVQSVFGTREGLIEAMLERWLTQDRERFEAFTGDKPTPRGRAMAHVRLTRGDTAEISGRMAALLAALAGSGRQSSSTARWYASRVGDLRATTDEERRLRLCFLAAEGAFYLRHLAGVTMSDELWCSIFDDIERITS